MTSTNDIVYLLTGRGIDGVVWRTHGGWVDTPGLADPFNTPEGAAGALAEALWAFNKAELDRKVGCLIVTEMDRATFERTREITYNDMERLARWGEEGDPDALENDNLFGGSREWDEECSG